MFHDFYQGGYYYEFPKPRKLEKKLKDMIESDVDEKYFLSKRFLDYANSTSKSGKFKRNEVFRPLTFDSDTSHTLTTRKDQFPSNYLIVPEATKKGYSVATIGDSFYTNRPHQKRGVVQKEKSITLTTQSKNIGVIDNDSAIRFLTPRECYRLMGFTDEDFDRAKKHNSETQLYKQAGNSIVVNVLEEIFRQLF